MNKRRLIRWIKILVIVYCLVGIALYFFQDRLLFHPVPLSRDHRYDFKMAHKEVNIPYDDKSNMNLVQFYTTDSVVKGVVLYFHGNRENIARYARFAPYFTKNGYEVWMLDYPGFGKSTGEFTEKRLYDWALTTYKLARARFSPDSIVIYGKSMGTGIAAQLAAVRDCKYLLLETPYYSFASAMGQYAPIYPYGRMVKFKIPTYQYLQQVTAPVIMFHGTDDGVIRLRNANKLKPFLKKQDEFITIPGGSHNDLAEFDIYKNKIDSLMKE